MKQWTKQEIDILENNYPYIGAERCSTIIGRTRRSVADKAHRLEIKFIKEKVTRPEKTTRRKRWTKQEIDFLISNYPNLGLRKCAQKLNRTINSINQEARRLDIAVTFECKSQNRRQSALSKYRGSKRINVHTFSECSIPETAYVLGYLWADGHFLLKSHIVGVDFREIDFQDILLAFNKTGDWYPTHRPQRNQTSPQAGLQISDKATFEFFANHGYTSGRHSSPDSIIAHTGEFAPYWFRGYFDGDGCFYHNPKRYLTQMSFAGIYNQDWSFIYSLLDDLGINHQTNRRHQGDYKSSVVKCSQKKAIWRFGNYIYGGEYDGIGLKRKHDLFLHITQSYSLKYQ